MTPPKHKRHRSSMSAAQLKEWRLRCGFLQKEAAEKLGCALSTLQGWEIGRRRIPGPVILLMDYVEAEESADRLPDGGYISDDE